MRLVSLTCGASKAKAHIACLDCCSAIKEMVFQPYTLPEHYFFQLDPEAKDVDTPTGVLVVQVLGADKVGG